MIRSAAPLRLLAVVLVYCPEDLTGSWLYQIFESEDFLVSYEHLLRYANINDISWRSTTKRNISQIT